MQRVIEKEKLVLYTNLSYVKWLLNINPIASNIQIIYNTYLNIFISPVRISVTAHIWIPFIFPLD